MAKRDKGASSVYFRNSRDRWDNSTTSLVSENLDSLPHFPKECRRQSKDFPPVLHISSVCQPFLLPADFDVEAKGLTASMGLGSLISIINWLNDFGQFTPPEIHPAVKQRD